MADAADALKKMLREVLAPLLASDGAELYLVAYEKKLVRLHLAGTLSGSPATDVVTRRIVEPAVRSVVPKAKVVVSSGWQVPKGAERIPGD
jgi:Fe-S cluster biogenesis protein NfuA